MVPSELAAQILRESLKPLCPDAPCVALDFEEKTELKRVLARDTILLNGALEIEAKIQEELKTSSKKDDDRRHSASCKSSVPPLASSKQASKFRRKRLLKQIAKMPIGVVPTNITMDAVGDMQISRRTVIHLRESRRVYPVYIRSDGNGSMFFLLFHPERLCWVLIHRCLREETWENLLVAYEESKADCVNPVLTLGGRWKFAQKYSSTYNPEETSSGYREATVGPIIGCRSEGKPVQIMEIPYLPTYQGDFAEKCGAEQNHNWLFASTKDVGDTTSLSFGTDRVLGTQLFPSVKKDVDVFSSLTAEAQKHIYMFLQEQTRRCLKRHRDDPDFRASSDQPCCLLFPIVARSYHQQYDLGGYPGCVNLLDSAGRNELLTVLGDQYASMVIRLEKGLHPENPLQRRLADIFLGSEETLVDEEEEALPDSAFPFISGSMPITSGPYQYHPHCKDDPGSTPASEQLMSRLRMSDMLVPQEHGVKTVRKLVQKRKSKKGSNWRPEMQNRLMSQKIIGVYYNSHMTRGGSRRCWTAKALSGRKLLSSHHYLANRMVPGETEKNDFALHRHNIEAALRSRCRMLQIPGVSEQTSMTGEDQINFDAIMRALLVFPNDKQKGRRGKDIRTRCFTERQYGSLDGAFHAALAYRTWKTAGEVDDRKPMDLLKDTLAHHIVLSHLKIMENSKGLGDWLEVELDRREREEHEFAEKCSKNPRYEKTLLRKRIAQRRLAKRIRTDPQRNAIHLLKLRLDNRRRAEISRARSFGYNYDEEGINQRYKKLQDTIGC